MRVTNIKQLEELHKIITNDDFKVKDEDNHILWVTNIFLDEQKNKYRNTKPIPCVIKRGSRFNINDSNYCLFVLEHNIWKTASCKYNIIEKIDEILIKGEAEDRGYLGYIHKFPNLKLFTTKKEAYAYIDKYQSENDLKKYKEKLSRITNDIEILLKEKERLENLINKYENK